MTRPEFNAPEDEGNGYTSTLMQISSLYGKVMPVTFYVTSDLGSKDKPAGKVALSSLKY